MSDEEKKKQDNEEQDEEGTEDEQDLESEDDKLDEDLDLADEDSEEDESEDSEEEDEESEDDDDEEAEDFDEKDLDDPEKRKAFIAELKKSKSSMKQRAIWKSRALKAGWGKEKEVPPKKPAKKPSVKQEQNGAEEAQRLNELTNFRLDHQDLPRRMVDQIQKFARANGVSMEKALRQPIVQNFVNNKKIRDRLSRASVSSKHRSPQSKPAKDWNRATPQEVEEHAREVRERAANRK